MWRVLLAFLFHRVLLLGTVLVALNLDLSSKADGKLIPDFAPVGALLGELYQRLDATPEVKQVKAIASARWIFSEAPNPFLWLTHALVHWLRMNPVTACLIVANFFALLFFWELYTLVSRMVTPEQAVATAVLAVLWPTSYELTLGSQFSAVCALSMLAVRNAVDDHWPLVGISLGLLAVMDSLAWVLLPLLLYYFWYYQRHYQLIQVLKRTVFFLVPIGAVWAWQYTQGRNGFPSLAGGVGLELYQNLIRGDISWLWGRSHLAQTLTLLIFSVGGVVAVASSVGGMYRIVPVFALVLLYFYLPFGSLGVRGLVSSVCLLGIAQLCAPMALRGVQGLFVILGMVEVFGSF